MNTLAPISKLILCAIFTLQNVLLSQPDNMDIFNYLDLNYPGLEAVKSAVESKDFRKAEAELLAYFQNRENRKVEFASDGFHADLEKAEKNVRNIFNIKSFEYNFGTKIDWTKKQKDKEWQYSLGRMNWFNNFVAAYAQTKDEKYVRAWMEQIRSWIKLGDPGYPRTIDTGRRMENLTESFWMFVRRFKSKSVTPEFNALLLESMYEQAEYLYQPEHWRRYSNWGTFENSGFAKFAILFPEFKRDKIWLKELFFRMRTQLQNSFYSDGMHVETSPAYHGHELSVWFDFVKLAQLNNIEEPWSPQIDFPAYKTLFVSKAKALMYMYKPSGTVAQVSDTDQRDERDILKEIGEYFNEPELIYAATNGKEGRSPEEISKVFNEGGYAILRSGWGNTERPFDKEFYLLFDFGNNRPWHAHYDVFNIVASAYCYDILKDPGRFTYNEGKERDAFKSTAYHNCVVVDSKNQLSNYKAPPIAASHTSSFSYLNGENIAYPGVVHNRSVFFVNAEYWIIVDRLKSEKEHSYEQFWHLSDKSLGQVFFNKESNTVSAPHLLLFTPPDCDVTIDTGYLSYSYRKKRESPVVHTRINKIENALLPTILFPFDEIKPEITATENTSSGVLKLTIKGENFIDNYWERTDSNDKFTSGGLTSDAKVIFIRTDSNENIHKLFMRAGSFIEYKDKELINIKNSKADVSFNSGKVEISGECINKFILDLGNIREVKLNNYNINVRKDNKIIYYNIE